MLNVNLNEPYETYIKSLIDSGLYSSSEDVIKDALRMHMNSDNNSKRLAYINAAIAEGEADIKAGRYEEFTPELIDKITDKVLQKNED